MAFKDRYHSGVQKGQFVADQHQTPIVQALQSLQERLCRNHAGSDSLFNRLRLQRKARLSTTPTRGLYIWGGVGRGKTWLMDEFLKDLPSDSTRRFHFHEFIQAVHQALNQLTHHRDPLSLVPRELFSGVNLICIDEFQVSDITDAMILHGLLEALVKQRISLIITSNITPDELYKNGLQRERFLPAIGLIQAYLQVIHLQGNDDYRAVHARNNQHLLVTSSVTQSDSVLNRAFNALIANNTDPSVYISIAGRNIRCRRRHSHAVWFDFEELCGTARATSDYIHLAQRYENVFISDIPIMDEYQDDKAKRFHNLIDELYDHHCQLYASMAVEPQLLYRGRRLQFEFQRTVSRLNEMATANYARGSHLSNLNACKAVNIQLSNSNNS